MKTMGYIQLFVKVTGGACPSFRMLKSFCERADIHLVRSDLLPVGPPYNRSDRLRSELECATITYVHEYLQLKLDSFSTKFSTRRFSFREEELVSRHPVVSDSLISADHPDNHIWHAYLGLERNENASSKCVIMKMQKTASSPSSWYIHQSRCGCYASLLMFAI